MSSISAVLIVEDEPILAKNMRRYLQSAGFEVVVAGTGETAMTALESARPDIVLLDYRLPDTNGLELIARIHAIDRRTPIIMITGEGSPSSCIHSLSSLPPGAVTVRSITQSNEPLRRPSLRLRKTSRLVIVAGPPPALAVLIW